jgi:hypothetical protein
MFLVRGAARFQYTSDRDCVTGSELSYQLSHELGIDSSDFYLLLSGLPVTDDSLFSRDRDYDIDFRLRLRGGKGGFGANLKSMGGRMSKKQTTNIDECRDLSGRRLKTVKDAKKLADLIESEPARRKQKEQELVKAIEEYRKPVVKPLLIDTEYEHQKEKLVNDTKSAVLAALAKGKLRKPVK